MVACGVSTVRILCEWEITERLQVITNVRTDKVVPASLVICGMNVVNSSIRVRETETSVCERNILC